ncbi:MAG: helix-hairpin-helix domain-containing protein [Xenococcaceae cyanobacterium]
MLGRLNPQKILIRQKIINNPYSRLENILEVQIAAELGVRIDVNQACVDDWLRLPGISIHQARSLVELVGMGMQLLCLEDVAAAIGVPIHRIQPLEPVLHFEYRDRHSFLSPQKVNPSTATITQLTQIPLLETDLAQRILFDRQKQGNYRNLADFQRRLGLDSQLVSQLMYYLQF